jgi:uncharacterized membrane protein
MIATNPVELALARVLRIGVTLSVILMLAGCGLHIFAHGSQPVELTTFAPHASNLGFAYTSIPGVAKAALLDRNGAACMQAGVLVLLITPTLRVIAALCMFIAKREHIYILFSAMVLLALAVGLYGGVGPRGPELHHNISPEGTSHAPETVNMPRPKESDSVPSTPATPSASPSP